MSINFNNEIENALKALKDGGIILYPTDTIWGIGCDATNSIAVKKIFNLKQREDTKTMIVLVAEAAEVDKFVISPPNLKGLSQYFHKPVTIIYENGKGVASELIGKDNSIAIRVVKDEFCETLIKKLGKPIVSTSANISGFPSPATFQDISDDIKKGVDYIVQHRRNDITTRAPSSIIELKSDGTFKVIRK